MSEFLSLLTLPFMQRALIAGTLLAFLLGLLGSFVNMKKMSFMGDGIAHASLAGIAFALLVGIAPTPVALVLSVFLAILLFYFEEYSPISADTAIGILFTTGMALGVLLLHFTPGFQPELISFLFGNILSISDADLQLLASVGGMIVFFVAMMRKQLSFVILDEEGAYLSGLKTKPLMLALYVVTSVSIVLSIKLVGIILVSALLITPSAIAQLLAKTFHGFQWQTLFWSMLIVWIGMMFSVLFDVPTGATIILTGSALFAIVFGWKAMVNE